jgi:hypothetical protein
MTLSSLASAPVLNENPLPLDRDLRVLFYEIGTVGVNNLLGYEAFQLFTELQMAEPDAAYPYVGLGVVGLATGDMEISRNNFTHPVVASSALAPFAQGLLAICHKLQGNNSGFEAASRAAMETSQGELETALSELGRAEIDLSRQ